MIFKLIKLEKNNIRITMMNFKIIVRTITNKRFKVQNHICQIMSELILIISQMCNAFLAKFR